MSGSRDSSAYGRFDELAEEFAARCRRGERPSLEEYVDRLPEMADEIREMFLALVEVERAQGDARDEALKHESGRPRLKELGDYRLMREIGRGGMGVVYEAEQVSLGRRVALKVLPGHVVGNLQAIERFRREAKAAARLHHTNIVPVFDVGQEGDVAFYAMQFIQGQGLDQVIAELARQSGPDRNAGPSEHGPAGSPRSVGPTQSLAIAPAIGLQSQKLAAVAQSLLSGRLGTEEATSSHGAASATTAGTRTEQFDQDATVDSQPRNAGPSFPALASNAAVSSAAVLPGGTVVSSVDSSNRRLPYFRSVAQIGRQAAQGLEYAHSRRIIHRDIKPSNLLLDTAGVVWIADFGLAKADEDGLTATGDILGTLRYMAPERFRGEGDARADVYALGLTLYELMTLRPAYESSDRLKLIEQIKTDEPQRPRSIDRHIPRDLETIVLKAIEKEAVSRYPSAEAMAEDLRRFLADEPIRARQVSTSERYWRWARRNPGVALLLAAVAASLVLGMAGTSYYAIQAGKREQEALANARIAHQEKARSDLRSYAAESTLAQKDWQEGELASLQQRLDLLVPHGPDAPDLRGFEWYHLQRLCRLDMQTLPGYSAPVRCVALSPNGKLLASASGNYGRPGEVKVWDLATGRELFCLRGHNDLVSCVAFSPDSRRLASANGGVRTPGEIQFWDAAAGRALIRVPAHATPVRGLAFSPDGLQLASVGGGFDSNGAYLPGEVKVWDAAGGRQLLRISGNEAADWPSASSAVAFSPAVAEPRRRLAFADGHTVRVCDATTGKELVHVGTHPNLVNSVAYSPNGRLLASGSVDGVVNVWDAESGKQTAVFHHADGISGLAFGPDCRQLAAAAGNSVVKIWDVTNKHEAVVLRGHRDTVASVAFSPDGWRLASGSGDGTVKLWDPTAAAEAVTLTGHFGAVNDLAFDSEGKRLALASSYPYLRVLDTTTGFVVFASPGHCATVLGVAFSFDDRRLASCGEDRTVRVWDATNGVEIFCFRGHTAPIRAVAFSPDGRRLASVSRESSRGGRPVPGEIMIWDLITGQRVMTLPGRPEPGGDLESASITFSPDGKCLATSEGRTVRVWKAATGQEILTMPGVERIVTRIAYSPDGLRLAVASQDGSVKVWDAVTGEACLAVRGRSTFVRGFAYSPDGRRLVTAAGGTNKGGERLSSEVKLWDALTGQEILTLRGATAQGPRVAFDRSGRRLAASGDGFVTIWEGVPLDAELAEDRRAASLVKFLFAQSPAPEAVSARVRDYATSDAVRRRALALVEPFRRNEVGQAAEQQVRSLFAKALFRSEVLAHLRDDPLLSEPVRQEAVALAERFVEVPFILNRESRAIAGRPGAEPSAYRLALQRSELACRLMPFEGSYLTTLAMAQFRLGKYQEALTTLTRADELNQETNGGPLPADLAFLAMSRYKLGETARAQASLTEMRATLEKPNWARNEEAQRLSKEAEALLEGHAVQPTK
jgi:eukaryotic-like serine/threonine-protein kinase